MKYKIGDVLTVKVSVAKIYEDGSYECTHEGLEGYYSTQDTDSMTFDEEDIIGLNENVEWIRKASEQLTPRRVKRWESGFACCPVCRKGVVKEDNFCGNCGQALEWLFE